MSFYLIHTMTIFNKLKGETYYNIKNYIDYYTNIKLIPDKKNKVKPNDVYLKFTTYDFSEQGISELVLFELINEKTVQHEISIRINPSRLIQKNNPNHVMLESDILPVNHEFNQLLSKFHDVNDDLNAIQAINQSKLQNYIDQFIEWKARRIDYSTNIITPHVALYIKLFQRADRPVQEFKELINPDTGKLGQLENSFYLVSKSATINFYDKQAQLLSSDKPKDPIKIATAKDILRIEIQCDEEKIKYIRKHDKNILSIRLYDLMQKELALEQLLFYYDKTVGSGDYHTFADAKKIINAQSNIIKSTKTKLIACLKFINNQTSLWDAREKWMKRKTKNKQFDKYIAQIRGIGINPICIPNNYEIKELPNIRDKIKENVLQSAPIEIAEPLLPQYIPICNADLLEEFKNIV